MSRADRAQTMRGLTMRRCLAPGVVRRGRRRVNLGRYQTQMSLLKCVQDNGGTLTEKSTTAIPRRRSLDNWKQRHQSPPMGHTRRAIGPYLRRGRSRPPRRRLACRAPHRRPWRLRREQSYLSADRELAIRGRLPAASTSTGRNTCHVSQRPARGSHAADARQIEALTGVKVIVCRSVEELGEHVFTAFDGIA